MPTSVQVFGGQNARNHLREKSRNSLCKRAWYKMRKCEKCPLTCGQKSPLNDDSGSTTYNSRAGMPSQRRGVPTRERAIRHWGMKTMEMNMGHADVALPMIFRASGKSSRDSHAMTPIACPNRTKTLIRGTLVFKQRRNYAGRLST